MSVTLIPVWLTLRTVMGDLELVTQRRLVSSSHVVGCRHVDQEQRLMPRPSRWPDIVEAAAHAFRERGFAATSLEDIATEVGIWKGSLYHYIDSKEDLLFAVVRGPADRILDDLRLLANLDLPPAEKIRRGRARMCWCSTTTSSTPPCTCRRLPAGTALPSGRPWTRSTSPAWSGSSRRTSTGGTSARRSTLGSPHSPSSDHSTGSRTGTSPTDRCRQRRSLNFTDLFLAGMLLRRTIGPATKRLEPPRPVKRPRAKPAS